MVDIIKAIQSTPILLLLIIAGIIFTFIGIAGKLPIPKFEITIPTDPQKMTRAQFLALFFAGNYEFTSTTQSMPMKLNINQQNEQSFGGTCMVLHN